MNSYLALIREAADSDYSVDFPDVPGCATAGEDLDEALAGHLRRLAEQGEALPEASSLEAVMAEPDNRDAVRSSSLCLLPVQALAMETTSGHRYRTAGPEDRPGLEPGTRLGYSLTLPLA